MSAARHSPPAEQLEDPSGAAAAADDVRCCDEVGKGRGRVATPQQAFRPMVTAAAEATDGDGDSTGGDASASVDASADSGTDDPEANRSRAAEELVAIGQLQESGAGSETVHADALPNDDTTKADTETGVDTQPLEDADPVQSELVPTQVQSAGGGESTAAESDGMSESHDLDTDELPPGWEAKLTEYSYQTKGTYYYYTYYHNHATETSQWEHPVNGRGEVQVRHPDHPSDEASKLAAAKVAATWLGAEMRTAQAAATTILSLEADIGLLERDCTSAVDLLGRLEARDRLHPTNEATMDYSFRAANIFRRHGEWEGQAIECAERALFGRRQILGDVAPDTVDAMLLLAECYEEQAYDDPFDFGPKAEELFEEAVNTLEQSEGGRSLRTLDAQYDYGRFLCRDYCDEGAQPVGLSLLQSVVERRSEVLGEGHRDTKDAIDSLEYYEDEYTDELEQFELLEFDDSSAGGVPYGDASFGVTGEPALSGTGSTASLLRFHPADLHTLSEEDTCQIVGLSDLGGFDYGRCAEVYLACDKDPNRAADCLFNHVDVVAHQSHEHDDDSDLQPKTLDFEPEPEPDFDLDVEPEPEPDFEHDNPSR